MKITKTIVLELAAGKTVSLDMSENLTSKIKEAFKLNSDDDITEKHVKYYLASSLSNAVGKFDGKQ